MLVAASIWSDTPFNFFLPLLTMAVSNGACCLKWDLTVCKWSVLAVAYALPYIPEPM